MVYYRAKLGGIYLKALNRAIDRFCYKHPRFGIPNLMLFIVIGNVIVYLFSLMDTTGLFENYLTFSAARVFLHGEVWRIFTFILVPNAPNILSLALFLYFSYFIGRTLEQQWGPGKFTIYYFSGIVLTLLYGILVWLITGISYGLTATYVNLSMFFAFATLYPDLRVLLFFFIPIKIKWLALVDAGYFLASMLINWKLFPINLLPLVALLNYAVFCGGYLLDYLCPAARRVSPRTVQFKNAARKAKTEADKKPYRYKCAVCGRTDTDHPELEFRYCSRCAGYHCFCQDHINNHIHFTE